MQLESCTTACLGDGNLLFIVGGIVVVALVALIVAFVIMKRNR